MERYGKVSSQQLAIRGNVSSQQLAIGGTHHNGNVSSQQLAVGGTDHNDNVSSQQLAIGGTDHDDNVDDSTPAQKKKLTCQYCKQDTSKQNSKTCYLCNKPFHYSCSGFHSSRSI